ncbi:hypothetical protein [Frigidibacter sp. MR17.24]|uniref:hypothetical protein n=1 Tax=Frigidibacter sp. MR17.24 TaxID=3127345 RepID=UPI003012C0C1
MSNRPPRGSALFLDAATLILATCLAHLPLLMGVIAQATDHFIHYRWASTFADSLAAGVLSPSWEAVSRGGLGDPVFVYYVPLYYYLVALLDRVTGDIWLAMRMLLIGMSLLSGLGVLVFSRRCGLGFWTARALAGLAVLAPMPVAVGELLNSYPWTVASGLLVFVVMALVRVLGAEGMPRARDLALLAALCGALSWLHSLTTLTFAFVLFFACAADWALHRLRWRLGLAYLACGGALLLGMLLSAANFWPAVSAFDLVTPTAFLKTVNVAWDNSFALPVLTPVYRSAVSYITPLGIGMVLAALAALAWRLRPLGRAERLLLWAAAIGFFLSIEPSYPVWAVFKPLQYVQRPFRFLTPTVACLVVLAPLLLARWSRQGRPVAAALRGFGSAPAALLMLGAWALTDVALHARLMQQALHDPQTYFAAPTPAVRAEFYETPEHLLRGAGDGWKAFLEAGGWPAYCAEAGAECRAEPVSPEHPVWTVTLSAPQRFRLPMIAFPAWQLQVDGESVALNWAEGVGLVELDLPAGTSRIEAVWAPLPQQSAGRIMSLAALAILALLVIAPGVIALRSRKAALPSGSTPTA